MKSFYRFLCIEDRELFPIQDVWGTRASFKSLFFFHSFGGDVRENLY